MLEFRCLSGINSHLALPHQNTDPLAAFFAMLDFMQQGGKTAMKITTTLKPLFILFVFCLGLATGLGAYDESN